MKKTRWPGNWKFACHRCGFWFPSGEIRRQWDGLLVCKKDWEPRHPQTLIKIRSDFSVPDFVSKDGTDTFVQNCDIFGSSPYAGMAVAGCAQAGTYIYTYAYLLDLSSNGHGVP
jgi:hypothetical protein